MEIKDVVEKVKSGELSDEEALLYLKQVRNQIDNSTLNMESRDCTDEKEVISYSKMTEEIAVVTMNDKANNNSLNVNLVGDLIEAFERISKDEKLKAVILRGRKDYFCTGGSLKGLEDIYNGQYKCTENEIYRLCIDCKLPVIAAIEGHALGAGWTLGLSCDFVFMNQDKYYSANFMELGFTPGFASTKIFPMKFNYSSALDILFTGKRFKGSELKERGYFHILPMEEIFSNCKQLAMTLAKHPRESLILLKAHMKQCYFSDIDNIANKEAQLHEFTFQGNSEVKKNILSLSNTYMPKMKDYYPELVNLNGKYKGTPIIWIHPGLGGADVYKKLAANISRPFWCIEPKGLRSDRIPMSGIMGMAAYYTAIICESFEHTDYELGGYSLGGLLAYEVSRQLEELGRSTKNILMIDTIPPEYTKNIVSGKELVFLQFINTLQIEAQCEDKLIMAKEISSCQSEEDLLTVAESKGLVIYKEQRKYMEKIYQLTLSAGLNMYSLLPMSDTRKTELHYIKNKKGLFFGKYQKFMYPDTKPLEFEDINYWEVFESQFESSKLYEVECESHLTILSEQKSLIRIVDICKAIYKA